LVTKIKTLLCFINKDGMWKSDEGEYTGSSFDIIHSEDDRIKQSLFYNIFFKKVILKTTLLKHILKEIKQILLNMFCFI
jgi:hypothetical protein